MIVNRNVFEQMERPNIFLCNPNRDRIASIGSVIYDTKLNLRFNALSEFSFTVPKSIDGGITTLPFYSKVKVKRQVYIEDVGYFIITSATEESDGSVPVVKVESKSLESEMISKRVNVLSGTFRLYNPIKVPITPVTFTQGSSSIQTSTSNNLQVGQVIRFANINVTNFTSGRDYYITTITPATNSFTVSTSPNGTSIVAGLVYSNGLLTPSPTDNLLDYLLSLVNMNVTTSLDTLGGWRITGNIDGSLASKFRTFDVSDSNVYDFLMNQVEKAYECIFNFNTIDRTIEVKRLDNAVSSSSIFISYDNLIENSEFSEMSDEIVTALHVYGGDGVDIRSVNPTGGNVIYNFDYYKNTDWMSQDLIDAIDAWETLIANNQTLYSNYIQDLITYYEDMAVLESEMATLESQYASLEVTLKAAIEINSGVSTARNNLNAKQAEIDAKNIQISNKQVQINNTTNNINTLATLLNINNSSNFTEEQRIELSKYIIENTYQNENIIILDSYTPAQEQQTKLDLYEQAQSVLSRVSVPRYEFSVESVNFVALKEFENFTSQIPNNLGVQVTINTHQGIIQAVMLELEMSYDNPEDFSLTFSNRLRLDNGEFQYSDLVGQVVKTGSSVSFEKTSWSNWTDNYKDEVSSFITSSLDATKNAIINSTNQEIVINGAGLRGRRLNGGTYEPNQVWLTSNTLAFTDDNWSTAKTAVGRINFGNGTYGYGIAGEYILGNIIAGNNLTITNSTGSFVVDGTGATLTNAKFTVQSALGGSGGLVIDPNSTNIFSIGTISGGVITSPKFIVNSSGNVTMYGNLEAGSNYIRTDGTARIGGLTITPTTATFTGEIVATKLTGSLDWNNITNVPANRIAYGGGSGSLSGSAIFGGTPTVTSLNSNQVNIGGASMYTVGSNFEMIANGYINLGSAAGGTVAVGYNEVVVSANSFRWGSNVVATQSWTQSWVNSQGFYNSGDSPSFSTLTITNDINIGSVSGVGSATTPVSLQFKDINNITRTITVRGGIVTALG